MGPGFGVHEAPGLLLDVVVAHRAGRVDRVGDLLLGGLLEIRYAVLIALLGHVAHPRAGEAVRLQLGAHAVAVGAGAVVRVLVHDPGDVLHVVPVLVSEDVELGEVAGRCIELLAQEAEERGIDVDGLFGRAVERTGLVGGRAARAARLLVDDDQLRRPIALHLGLPVLIEHETAGREAALVVRVRIGARLALLDLGLLAGSDLRLSRDDARQILSGEQLEQDHRDRTEAGDAAACHRHAAASTPRRIPPDVGVLIERHAVTVPRQSSAQQEPFPNRQE